MTFRPPLLVLQPSNGGLAAARAVARRDVEVELLATSHDWYTAHSGRGRGEVLPAFGADDERWVAALAERGDAVALAGSDEASEFLSRRRGELPQSLRFFERHDDVHLDLMDKTRSYAIAADAGVKVPWLRAVRTAADLEEAAAEVPYPCVLKPVLTHEWRPIFGLERVLLSHSPGELRAHGERALAAGIDTIVSEYVPGGDDCVEEAILVRAADGSFPMEFGCHKLRQSPAGFGAASLCESAPLTESLAMARTVLEHSGYVGVAGVETKRHADTGEHYFIEVNVRLPTQFGLGDACGADAAWRTYATLAGIPLGPRPRPEMGIRLVFPELELALLRNGRGGRSWREFLAGYRRVRELGVLDPRDLRPGLALAARSLERRLRGHSAS